jgi:chemotaxis-related protein WspD
MATTPMPGFCKNAQKEPGGLGSPLFMEPHDTNSNLELTTGGLKPFPGPLQPADREIVDCWNKIGVNGDGTCAELAHFVHCRNCSVHSAAAAQLLDRELPADYRRNWTEQVSHAKRRVKPGKMSVVIFRIGTSWLALPTGSFQEVAERRKIHSMPHRQQGIVLGVINFRGELLLCISLGRLLGIEQEMSVEKGRTIHDRLAVTEWRGSLMTFPVDEIHGIHRYHPEELMEAPATVLKATSHFTRGILPWQDKMVDCLNEEAVFATVDRSLT